MPKGIYLRSEREIQRLTELVKPFRFQKGKKPWEMTDKIRKNMSEAKKGKPSTTLGKHWTWTLKSKQKIKGKENSNWKGGNSRKKHCGLLYESWTKKIFQIDNYTCWICEIHSGCGYSIILNAHHLKSWIKHSKLRFKVSNGITLCGICHMIYGYHKKKEFKHE